MTSQRADDRDEEHGFDPEQSGVRRTTAIRPVASRPPPMPSPTALRPARVPRPSEPARPEPMTPTRRRVAALERSLERVRAAYERELRELQTFRAQLEQKERRLSAFRVEMRAVVATLEARVVSMDRDRQHLVGELRRERVEGYREAERIGHRLMQVERRLSSLEEGAELSLVRLRLEREGHRVGALEDRVGAVEHRADRLEQGPDITRLRMRLDRLSRRVDALEVHDLTELRGVGPRFAARMRAMGVRRFEHLAAWSDDDIARAVRRLGVSPRRIRAWMAEAAQRAEGSLPERDGASGARPS